MCAVLTALVGVNTVEEFAEGAVGNLAGVALDADATAVEHNKHDALHAHLVVAD